MPRLNGLLRTAFPASIAEADQIVTAVAARAGVVANAEQFAVGLGYDSRHQLARVLGRAGLPPLEQIAAWARALSWVLRWESQRHPLARMAQEAERDAAICYKLITRLTGRRWKEVAALGSGWVVMTIRQKYGFGPVPEPSAPTTGRRRSGEHQQVEVPV